MTYEIVIGLEVHVQLNTQTKAFCGCSNLFGLEPNTQVCPVCLGFPGSLPVLNKKALESGIKAALSVHCKVNNFTKFDRKNYFYPDLPKNYQISQFDIPLSENGYLDIKLEGREKHIRIKRIHLEEDAGKLIHDISKDSSHVDFNRCGTPLLEIVSEPDISSPQEAYVYLNDLKLLIRYLGISDCDMEKGSLRCDANISLRKQGEKLGVKSEVKNLNSFRAVRDALVYEARRQEEALNNGEKIIQETRLWDDQNQKTFSMRSKEESHDYRYFPEPDLPPFIIDDAEIEEIRKTIGELPQERKSRFGKDYSLDELESEFLISDKALADYFEEAVKLMNQPKKVINWLRGAFSFELNSRNMNMANCPVKPKSLVGLIEQVENGLISNLTAKDVLSQMFDTQKEAQQIIKDKNLAQVSDESSLAKIVGEVISENQKSIDAYLSGKENALMFLVGQVMRKSQGKANPKIVGEMLKNKLTPNLH